ncbi:DMT family transporter [uncultured Pelagimonas sp.]|uniref:DMT family transporter n=1 Tax=uncultured Pelagimonas sp. TaxID=1618102 RepID=UPI002612945E|nr:DMT family transporter [uncultured Pelagimonas sp.]
MIANLTEPQRGHLAMLGFSALVAGSFSLGGMSAGFIEPEVLNAVRFVVAGAVMALAAWLTGGMSRSVWVAPWRYFVLAGLFVFYFVTMFEGLKTAEPVSMAAVFTLNPALSAMFGYVLIRQITTARMALAIVIGGIGALWVIFRGDPDLAMRFEIGRGEMIYFWGCIAHALYAPLVRVFSRGEPALAFTAGVLIAGALILCLWAGPGLVAADWANMPNIVWVTIFYTAIAATGLTFLAVRYAALRLPAAKVMAYTYLVPSWVILWELAMGRTVPTAMVLPGVALTVLALVMLLKDEEPQVASA